MYEKKKRKENAELESVSRRKKKFVPKSHRNNKGFHENPDNEPRKYKEKKRMRRAMVYRFVTSLVVTLS